MQQLHVGSAAVKAPLRRSTATRDRCSSVAHARCTEAPHTATNKTPAQTARSPAGRLAGANRPLGGAVGGTAQLRVRARAPARGQAAGGAARAPGRTVGCPRAGTAAPAAPCRARRGCARRRPPRRPGCPGAAPARPAAAGWPRAAARRSRPARSQSARSAPSYASRRPREPPARAARPAPSRASSGAKAACAHQRQPPPTAQAAGPSSSWRPGAHAWASSRRRAGQSASFRRSSTKSTGPASGTATARTHRCLKSDYHARPAEHCTASGAPSYSGATRGLCHRPFCRLTMLGEACSAERAQGFGGN